MAFYMDFLDLIQSMSDVLMGFWDVHQGWEIVKSSSPLFSDRETITNAIGELLEYVQEEDKETY